MPSHNQAYNSHPAGRAPRTILPDADGLRRLGGIILRDILHAHRNRFPSRIMTQETLRTVISGLADSQIHTAFRNSEGATIPRFIYPAEMLDITGPVREGMLQAIDLLKPKDLS